MIRILDFRFIIEKTDTHEKYYPKVISFSTIEDYPLSEPPSADITVFSPSDINNVATVSQIEFDDIVRLQVSERFHELESYVWVDIFEGRVENQSKEFSTNNEITISCKGHIQEAFYRNISVNLTWANKDASAILKDLDVYVDRINHNSSLVETGLNVTEYNMQIDQNMVVDAYKEFETLSGYKRIIDVVPVYNSSGDLQTCNLRLRQFPETPTTQYAVIEGTPGLISATFDVVGEDMANYRHVHGGTDSGGNVYAGGSWDSASIAKYGMRDQIDTFTWINSNSLCTEIAAGLKEDSKLPYVAGEIVFEGTPYVRVGDLVPVWIPSIEVEGSQINGNYTVKRVTHTLSAEGFRTAFSVGHIKKSAYDYIAKNIARVVKTCYKNQVT